MARVGAALAALTLLRSLQEERRAATAEEQLVLARWPGFGAISEVFDEDRPEYAAVREQLHALTTDEEYAALRRTTRNAHYTDAGYVEAIWEALAALGFTGGRVLEPGCGSGHFIGFALPGARMTGVERDPVTAGIAAALYPDADIMTGSFADTRLPAASFDAAVGNVPFGKTKLRDPVYNGSGLLSMHDHFIVKSLAMTRPGGIVALLTSRYTMDARNPQARRQMAEMADLVAAVRLPSGAHRRAAGTDAVTDLLILRRRMPGEAFITGQPWEKSLPVDVPGGQVHVNEYFTARPEMVLGQMQAGTGMYSNTELAVKGDRNAAAALRAALEQAVARANDAGLVMTGPPAAEPAPGPRPADAAGLMPDPMPGMIRAHSNGSFTRVIDVYDDGTTSEQPFQVPKTQAAELRRLLRLRDLARALIRAERDSADDSAEISGLRDKLNREYDSYLRLHGPVKRFKWGNPRAKPAQPAGDGEAEDQAEQEETASRVLPPQGGFRKDPYHHAAYALEKSYDPVTGTAVKQDIFTQRVIAPPQPLLGADTAEEALAICLSQHGELRLDVIARLLGLPSGQAREELGTLVYDDPEAGTPVWAPLYLSGNVRKKLTAARAAAETDSRFEVNVAALAEVVPRDRGPAEIEAQLGAGWIDPVYVQQFIRDILGEDDTTPKPTKVKQSKGGYWHVTDGSTTSVAAVSTWGTSRLCAQELLERLLKGTAEHIRLTEKADDETVYDPEATEAAKAKARQIAARFSSWVWEDPDRSAALCRAFNNAWASRVAPDFDNVRLVLPGLSPLIKLRPNQIPGIARIIFQDSAGMVQDTGAGKTKITVIGMHERHRLGLAPKPCIVVQRGKLSDWRDEWLECYPAAKLLVADTPDLRGDKRREFVAQCATGNPDAIILSREAFTKIGVSNETHAEFIRRELEDLREALEDAREDGIRWTIKQIETRIENAEERLEKWASEIGHDAGLTIEDTGITDIAVDEAQGYRVGPLTSAIPGESAKGSDRARDLLEKAYYLKQWLGSTRLTLLSARPFVNRLSELYVWLRYLGEDVGPYDPFCRTFAKMLPGYEMTPDGSFKVRSRLREVINAPDMHLVLRGKSDFKLYGHGLNLQLPRLRGGKPEITAVDATGAHAEYAAYLKERIQLLPGGPPEKGNDIWIAVQNDAIKAALDLRLVYRDTDEPQKALVTARKIWGEWLETRDNVYLHEDGAEHPVKGGLILCFASLGVPGDHEGWNFYDEVRGLLIKWGMPPRLVRYVQEARDMRELEDIYHGARNGGIHVLFASTQKGGEGLNVQNRCVGGVHVTSPWNWDEPDQEKGRYVRPGNQNEEVFCHRIVTSPSCDALKWQRAKDKRDAFYKLMTGEIDGRTIRVPDDDLTPAELIAASSGDPRHIERARLEATIARLDMVRSDWARNQSTLTYRAQSARTAAARHERDIVAVDAAIKRRKDTRGDAFAMTVNGRRYAKRPEAGAALTQLINQHVGKALGARAGDRNSTHAIGELGGFGVTLKIDLDAYFGAPVQLHLDGIPDLGDPVAIPSIESLDQLDGDNKLRGLVARLENRVAGLENTRAQLTAQAAARRREAEAAEAETGTEFPQEAELAQLRAQLEELEADLFAEAIAAENDTGPDPGTDTTGVADGEDTEQVRPALPRRHANLEQAAAGAVSRARSSGYTCYVYPDGDRITCSGQRPATAAYYSVTPRGLWSRHMEGAVFDVACPWPRGRPEDLGHFFRVIAGRPAAANPVTHAAAGVAADAAAREAASTGQPWHLHPEDDGYTSCGRPPAHAAYFTVASNGKWTRRMHGAAADTERPSEQDLISIAGEVAGSDWTAAHPFAAGIRRLRHDALASEPAPGDPDRFAAAFWDWTVAEITASPVPVSEFALAYLADPSFAADVTATLAEQVYRLLRAPEPRAAAAAAEVFHAEACTRAAAAAKAAISPGAQADGRDGDLRDAVTIDMHLARAGISPAARGITWDSDAGCYAVDLAGEEETRFRLAIPPAGAAYTIRPGGAPAITLPTLRGRDDIAGLLLSHAGLTSKDAAGPSKPPDFMEELAGRHGMHVTREGGETIIRDPGNMPVLRSRDGQLENRPGRVIPASRAAAYVAAAAESPQDQPDVLYARVVSGAPVSDGMPDEQAVRIGDYHHARDGAAGRASRAAATRYVYADRHAYVTASTPPPAAAYLSVTAEGQWASCIDGVTSYVARPPGPHDFSAVCGKLAASADRQQTPPAPAGHEMETPSQQAPAAAPAAGKHLPGGTPAAAGDPLAPWQELAGPHGLTAMYDEEYPGGGILIRHRDDPPRRFALCQPAPGDSVLNQNGRPVPVPRMAAYLAAYAAGRGAAPDQLYAEIAPQAAGERSFPGNDRLTARDTAADQATRTRGSWHLYAHGQALVCTSREPGNGPYFTVSPDGQWSAHGGAPFLPAGRPPDPVKFVALISLTPARHEVHPATVPAAGAAGGEEPEPPAGSLGTLAAAHGMYARVHNHNGTTVVFRSEVRAGQPVLRQDSPGGPLLNQPGRIIPEEHAGAYLAAAARDDALSADDLYQAVIPGAAARERAWPRARGHVTFSTAAIRARETGQPWAVYVDGQAAVAAPGSPASGAAYYLVTPNGQDVHWTRHLHGETEPVSHHLRPQDLSVIAREAATAPGPPAQRQSPAQPPPGQAPRRPGAAQDADDWTVTHPLTTDIETMRQAALADARLAEVARANREDNFGLVFEDWADGYVAGLYPDPGSAAPAAPPFAGTYFDDLAFRGRLIPTLRHQVHQALHDSPAPGPQTSDGNPPAAAHLGTEPGTAVAADLLPYRSGPELAAGQLATARAWQSVRRAADAALPRGDTGQIVSRHYENTGTLLQQAETAGSAQDAIRGYAGTAEAADRIAGATTDPGGADYYYPLRAAARQLAGAARQHAGRMTAAGLAAQELFTDPDARDVPAGGHTDPLSLLPAPYPSGTEAGEAGTAIFNLARDAQAASGGPGVPESVTQVYSRLGSLHVLPGRDHPGDRIASWRELPAAVFTALADLSPGSPAAAPLAGIARAVTAHWLRLDSYRLRAEAAASPYGTADSYTAGAAALRQAWAVWRQSPTGSRLATVTDRDARGSDLWDQRDAHRRLQAEHYQLGAHDPGTDLAHASTRAAATACAAYALLLDHRPGDFRDPADQAVLQSLTEAAYLHAARIDAARGAGTAPLIAAGLAAQAAETPREPGQAEPAPAPEADPAPPARLVIEHHHAGTVVRGTDNTDLPLHKILSDAKFKFSRRWDFWYLPRPWSQDTRERHVRQLTAGLDRLGCQYTLQDHPSETATPPPTPAPIQAGEPYTSRAEAQQGYQRAKRAWWAVTDTDAGRKMFSYARNKRPDVLALQAAERALPAGVDLTGTAGELAPGLMAWAQTAQVLLDNLTAERHRAPKFRTHLEALATRTRTLAARMAGTAAQGGFPGDPGQAPAPAAPRDPAAATDSAPDSDPGRDGDPDPAAGVAESPGPGTASAAGDSGPHEPEALSFPAPQPGEDRAAAGETPGTPGLATRTTTAGQAPPAAPETGQRTAATGTGGPPPTGETGPPADAQPSTAPAPAPAPGRTPDGDAVSAIPRVTVLHGHTSQATAYLTADYPYGRTLRCKRRSWLETAVKGSARGQVRLVHQTTNPKRAGEMWNKEHPSTYSQWGVMYLDANGHLGWHAVGTWGPGGAQDALIHLDGTYDQLTDPQRAGYDKLVARAKRNGGWESWDKALAFITTYAGDHGELPTPGQLAAVPGFYLEERHREIVLAAARHLPAARQDSPSPAGEASTGTAGLTTSEHPGGGHPADPGTPADSAQAPATAALAGPPPMAATADTDGAPSPAASGPAAPAGAGVPAAAETSRPQPADDAAEPGAGSPATGETAAASATPASQVTPSSTEQPAQPDPRPPGSAAGPTAEHSGPVPRSPRPDEVVVNVADWAPPGQIPAGWLIVNAPRPLNGEIIWEGEFRHGIFYAAAPPATAGLLGWQDADAWPVRLTSDNEIARTVARYLADHGYQSAEEATVTVAEVAADLGLPWRGETGPRDTPRGASPGSGLPDGTRPLAVNAQWGGNLRPERLLYTDGTLLTVRGQGEDGDEAWPATAAGVVPAEAGSDYGDGRLQVVRWDDSSYTVVHPALACPRDVDPYAGLSDRDRARWEAFDAAEAFPTPVAGLLARLIDTGDVLQVERGPRSRKSDMREVQSVMPALVPRSWLEVKVKGVRSSLYYPGTHRAGVFIPEEHPSLARAIRAATATPGEDAGRGAAEADTAGAAGTWPAPAPARPGQAPGVSAGTGSPDSPPPGRPAQPGTGPDQVAAPIWDAAQQAARLAAQQDRTYYLYRSAAGTEPARCLISPAPPQTAAGYLSVTADGTWTETWRGQQRHVDHQPHAWLAPDYPLTLTEARALARAARLDVHITRAAGQVFVSLAEPGAAAAPALSFAYGTRDVFGGRQTTTPSHAIAWLDTYRAAVDEQAAGRIFTAGDSIPGWKCRVAHLVPHLPSGPHHERGVRDNLATAIRLAQQGRTGDAEQALGRAETASPSLVLSPAREAQLTDKIRSDAAGYAWTGSPARYIAETTQATPAEWEWIEGYIAAHPDVLTHATVTARELETSETAAQAGRAEAARTLSGQAKAAYDQGDHAEALALIDDAETLDQGAGTRYQRIREIITGTGASPAAAAPDGEAPAAPAGLPDLHQQPPAGPAPDPAPAPASPERPPPRGGQQGAAGTGTGSQTPSLDDIPQPPGPGTGPGSAPVPASGESPAQLAGPVPDPGPDRVPMRFMNDLDIEQAVARWQDHPVLGPAARTLASLEAWADANSDGWAYWPKPARAAARLMSLIERDGTARYAFGTDRADATPGELLDAYKPIKAFRTRQQADFTIENPGEPAPPDGLFPAPADTGVPLPFTTDAPSNGPRHEQAGPPETDTSEPAQPGPGRAGGLQPGHASDPTAAKATANPAPAGAAAAPGGTSEQDPGPGTPQQADGGPPSEDGTSVVTPGTPAATTREAGEARPLSRRIRIDTSTARPAISGTDDAQDPPELRAALHRHHFEWSRPRQRWEYAGPPAAASEAVTAIRRTLAELGSHAAAPRPGASHADIIAAALQGRSLAFDPAAGTGSTAALAQIARELGQRSPATRILYLAPGTGAVLDQFPDRVTCTPLHSLAGQALSGTSYAAKVRNLGAGARTPQQWARILGIPAETPTSAGTADAETMALLAMHAVSQFRDSSDAAPGAQHLPPSAGKYADLAHLAVAYAQAAWDNITAPRNAHMLTGDEPGALVVTRGDLVKIWALTQPQLDAGLILADAAQHTTGAARHIIASQHAQVIVAGASGPWLAANAAARSQDPGQRVPAWDAFPAGLPAQGQDREPGPDQAAQAAQAEPPAMSSPGLEEATGPPDGADEHPTASTATALPGQPEPAQSGAERAPEPEPVRQPVNGSDVAIALRRMAGRDFASFARGGKPEVHTGSGSSRRPGEPDAGASETLSYDSTGIRIRIDTPSQTREGHLTWAQASAWLEPGLTPARQQLLREASRARSMYNVLAQVESIPGTPEHQVLQEAAGELGAILSEAQDAIVAAALARNGPGPLPRRPARTASRRAPAGATGAPLPLPGEDSPGNSIAAALTRIAQFTAVLPAWPPRLDKPLSEVRPGDSLRLPGHPRRTFTVTGTPRHRDGATEIPGTVDGAALTWVFDHHGDDDPMVWALPPAGLLTGPIPPAAQATAPAPAGSQTADMTSAPEPGTPAAPLTSPPGGQPASPGERHTPGRRAEPRPASDVPADVLAREAAQLRSWNAAAYARAGISPADDPEPAAQREEGTGGDDTEDADLPAAGTGAAGEPPARPVTDTGKGHSPVSEEHHDNPAATASRHDSPPRLDRGGPDTGDAAPGAAGPHQVTGPQHRPASRRSWQQKAISGQIRDLDVPAASPDADIDGEAAGRDVREEPEASERERRLEHADPETTAADAGLQAVIDEATRRYEENMPPRDAQDSVVYAWLTAADATEPGSTNGWREMVAQQLSALPGSRLSALPASAGPATASAAPPAAPPPLHGQSGPATAADPAPDERMTQLEARVTELEEALARIREDGTRAGPAPATDRVRWQGAVTSAEGLQRARDAAARALPALRRSAAWRRTGDLLRSARKLAADARRGLLRFADPARALRAWNSAWARACEITGDLATGLMSQLRRGSRPWTAARSLRHAAAEGAAHARGWLPRSEHLPPGSYEPPPGYHARTWAATDAATRLHDAGAGPLNQLDFPGALEGVPARRAPSQRDMRRARLVRAGQGTAHPAPARR